MNKAALLKCIAETGYNVGFGGRKHWATYDIVDKVPGLIAFFSTAMGIFALVNDSLSAKNISAALTVLGVIGIYISVYDSKKGAYEETAAAITKMFNALRDLYRKVEHNQDESKNTEFHNQLKDIESDYYSKSMSKQILFSDWYAHYKFFWQYQIDWVAEQKKFTFWRDKIPLTGWIAICAIIGMLCWQLLETMDAIKLCYETLTSKANSQLIIKQS